ncbi:MAG: carboxypeptidase regulatory-like domain-containing protein [Acidobacteria bacterium Pan2503]|uniref:Carboxypeptidase regulatory-like domain-containing protein n=1 Tax=Candidatus Acidiferrum panamense TaxID=2741543 RepID=A0A7V8NTR6_9BACT|nr:carboxypeptidase regulatory-like domain-containing protein [Candidatus Acidoferrum panamensis]
MILQVWKLKLRSFFLLFSLFTVASLGQASSARAQGSFFGDPLTPSLGSRTGQVLGTVYLNRGAEPAPQVVVNVRSLSSGTIRTVLSDVNGRFEMNQIPQGTYEVSSSEKGHGFASTIADVNFFPAEITLYLNSSFPKGYRPKWRALCPRAVCLRPDPLRRPKTGRGRALDSPRPGNGTRLCRRTSFSGDCLVRPEPPR